MLTQLSTDGIRSAIEITQQQYALIAHSLPVHRGEVAISNRYVRNAFLYVVAHGCKWRALPQRFINWHTIDTRISRRSKAGVRDRIVAAFHQAHILRLRSEAVSLDATDSKVHPDGGRALKKMANNRLESVEADGPSNCIRLARMRERSWHFVYRQAIIMMRPLVGY